MEVDDAVLQGGKYALEALYMQAHQYAALSPQDAFRILHNRGFNLNRGPGRNIPLDLMVEHANNQIKELLSQQGANVTFESTNKASSSIEGVYDILDNLDNNLNITPESGEYAVVNKHQDITAIVTVLAKKTYLSLHSWQSAQSFSTTRARFHLSFTGGRLDTVDTRATEIH